MTGVGVLHHLAVQAHLNFQVHGVWNFVSRDHPWAIGTGLLKVFAGVDLAGVALVIPQASLVHAGVTKHVVQGVFGFDIAACGLANHHQQLGLPVQHVRDLGAKNRHIVASHGFWPTCKHHGTIGHFAVANGTVGLIHVVVVIQAHAQNFFRKRHDRQKLQVFVVEVARLLLQHHLGNGKAIVGNKGHDVGVLPAQTRCEVHHFGALDSSVVNCATMYITYQFHRSSYKKSVEQNLFLMLHPISPDLKGGVGFHISLGLRVDDFIGL